MPRDASFAIRKDAVASAGESVMDCRKKIETIAHSLESVESGLQGTTGALAMMAGVVKSLREGMRYNAERTERIGAAAKWCAFRYDNADRSLLSEPLEMLDALPPAPVKPAAPVSLEAIKEMAKKEIRNMTETGQAVGAAVVGAAIGAGGSGDSGNKESGVPIGTGTPTGNPEKPDPEADKTLPGTKPGNEPGPTVVPERDTPKETKPAADAGKPATKPDANVMKPDTKPVDPRLDENGRATVSGKYEDYVVKKKSEWNNSWKKKPETTRTYESVDLEIGTDDDGKRTEKVLSYSGLVESGGIGVALLTTTKARSYDVTNYDGNLSSLDNAASMLGEIEKGLTHNPGMLSNNWSKGTWEKEPDPQHPGETRWVRKQGRDAQENAFSKDIVGAKLVDVTLLDEKKSAYGKQIFGDKGKLGEYDLSVSAGDVSAKAAAAAGVYYTIKDGRKCLAVGAEGEIGAAATAFTVKADGKIHIPKSKAVTEWVGEDFQFAEAEAKGEVKVGHAEAKAGGKARWIAGKGPEIVAEGNVGAYLAKANGTVSGTLMGVKASATGEVSVGFGISGKFGLTGGRLRAEFGAALGLGAKISFDLDIGGAVDGVKNLASKTFQTIKDSVPTLITKAAPVIESAKTVVKETAKEVVNAVGDAIVNLTKKVFSWW